MWVLHWCIGGLWRFGYAEPLLGGNRVHVDQSVIADTPLVFLPWNTTNVHFCTFVQERFHDFRLMYSAGQIAGKVQCPTEMRPTSIQTTTPQSVRK
jgi:hypothetical protein